MIVTKLLCRVGWHDKIRAEHYYFDAQGRAVLATVVRCHDCDYHRMTETFAPATCLRCGHQHDPARPDQCVIPAQRLP